MAQSIAFVFVMGGVAVIAVLAFIAYLLMRQPNSRARATDDVAREGKRLLWMEYLLAIVVLLVVVQPDRVGCCVCPVACSRAASVGMLPHLCSASAG